MIEVENLTKRYGRTLAVDGISFSVGAGRHYCKLQGYVNFVEVVTYD